MCTQFAGIEKQTTYVIILKKIVTVRMLFSFIYPCFSNSAYARKKGKEIVVPK
jgi:hypothetical protein